VHCGGSWGRPSDSWKLKFFDLFSDKKMYGILGDVSEMYGREYIGDRKFSGDLSCGV